MVDDQRLACLCACIARALVLSQAVEITVDLLNRRGRSIGTEDVKVAPHTEESYAKTGFSSCYDGVRNGMVRHRWSICLLVFVGVVGWLGGWLWVWCCCASRAEQAEAGRGTAAALTAQQRTTFRLL